MKYTFKKGEFVFYYHKNKHVLAKIIHKSTRYRSQIKILNNKGNFVIETYNKYLCPIL
jgi:hypothetical protein